MKINSCSELVVVLLLNLVVSIVCPPPVGRTDAKQEDVEKLNAENRKKELEGWESGLEYDRYLKQVITVLEEDRDFRKRLETADPKAYENGDIANELEFASHAVRSKLDEIKRKEIHRLREKLKQARDVSEFDVPGHVNHFNEETFEPDDLKKLIQRTSQDLQKVDDERKKDFKEYEMKKEHERREKLKHMTEEERKKAEKEHEDELKKRKDHPKVHHPGSKEQLEEVWEESDGLDPADFNPKTFFALHDMNGDGYLDQREVEALFQKELDKVYDPNDVNFDAREREEEASRMREHVLNEVDKDHDGLVSLQEFMQEAESSDFNEDNGWDGLEDQDFFSEEDLMQYERELAAVQGLDPSLGGGGYHPDQVGYPHPPPNYPHPNNIDN